MLKLLNPTELAKKKGDETARNLMRIEELRALLVSKQQELSKLEADFEVTLANQQLRWAKVEEKKAKELVALDTEIQELEQRRKQLLIPIEIDRARADTLLNEAKLALSQVQEKEQHLEELTEQLEERLDEVSSREEDINQAELSFALKKKTLLEADLELTERSKALGEATTIFTQERTKAQAHLLELKKELELKSINLTATEERLNRKEKELKVATARLKDERETLARAWSELKSKQYEHNKTS